MMGEGGKTKGFEKVAFVDREVRDSFLLRRSNCHLSIPLSSRGKVIHPVRRRGVVSGSGHGSSVNREEMCGR